MKSTRLLLWILTTATFLALMAGCGGGGGGGDSPTLVAITVTPANSTLQAGNLLNFVATGTYSDNGKVDLTQSANWSSTVQTVATVSNGAGSKGTVSGIAAGTTQIIAIVGAVSGSTNLTVTGSSTASANVMTVTVNGSLCSAGSYPNKPCVSVTICNPGSSTCQTVPDILLDTGSHGLRIFRSTIPGLTLAQVPSGLGLLAECVQFADGSSLWGPVQIADVRLGNEPAVQIPIQVVDATLGTRPTTCIDASASPEVAGFNGILGVGVSVEDCGQSCVNSAGIGFYYRCTGTSCSGTTVSLSNQVQNPVARLPEDNNGVLVQLPSVPLGGVPSLNGNLILGIGTRANNLPASPIVIPTDDFGNFRTVYNGVNSTSFIDTGSNGIFFLNIGPDPLPACADPNADWYCPPVTRALLGTVVGAFGSPSLEVNFEIGNLSQLISSSNRVFREIGGPSGFGFDWGLPFFMGRNVFVGIEGRPSPLRTGPYVAW